MAEYSYAVSLRLRHPTADLAVLAEPLGLRPKGVCKAGEPRFTQKGAPLKGVYPVSYWHCPLIEDAKSVDRSLGEALDNLLDHLSTNADFFRDFAGQGGRAEFFIGWFFDDGNSGDVLNHALLGRLANLGIDLSFDVYGPTQIEAD